jgi:AbrB family looped-hinge helix DNA binding protein
MTHRMGAKGQVVIPKDLREAIGLQPGDDVEFVMETGGVRVEPARPRRARAGLLGAYRLVDALESEHQAERQ